MKKAICLTCIILCCIVYFDSFCEEVTSQKTNEQLKTRMERLLYNCGGDLIRSEDFIELNNNKKESIPALIAIIGDKDTYSVNQRKAACDILLEILKNWVVSKETYALSSNSEIQLSNEQYKHLRNVFMDKKENSNVRKGVAWILYMHGNTSFGKDLYKTFITDKDPEVRASSLYHLESGVVDGKYWYIDRNKLVKYIIYASQDSNDDVRMASASAMFGFRKLPQYEKFIPILKKMINDKNGQVRSQAIRSLSTYGEIDKTIVSDIAALVHDRNPGIRAEAKRELENLKRREVITNEEYKAMVGQEDRPYTDEEIVKLMDSSDVYFRDTAIFSIFQRKLTKDFTQALIKALSDPYPRIRSMAIQILEENAGKTYGYRHDGPVLDRQRAIRKWEKWFRDKYGTNK